MVEGIEYGKREGRRGIKETGSSVVSNIRHLLSRDPNSSHFEVRVIPSHIYVSFYRTTVTDNVMIVSNYVRSPDFTFKLPHSLSPTILVKVLQYPLNYIGQKAAASDLPIAVGCKELW